MIKALLFFIILIIFIFPSREGFEPIKWKNSLRRRVRRAAKNQKKKMKEHLQMIKQYLPKKNFLGS